VRRLELTRTGTELVDRVIAAGEEHQQRLLQRLDMSALETVAHAFDLMLAATDAATHPGDCGPSTDEDRKT